MHTSHSAGALNEVTVILKLLEVAAVCALVVEKKRKKHRKSTGCTSELLADYTVFLSLIYNVPYLYLTFFFFWRKDGPVSAHSLTHLGQQFLNILVIVILLIKS